MKSKNIKHWLMYIKKHCHLIFWKYIFFTITKCISSKTIVAYILRYFYAVWESFTHFFFFQKTKKVASRKVSAEVQAFLRKKYANCSALQVMNKIKCGLKQGQVGHTVWTALVFNYLDILDKKYTFEANWRIIKYFFKNKKSNNFAKLAEIEQGERVKIGNWMTSFWGYTKLGLTCTSLVVFDCAIKGESVHWPSTMQDSDRARCKSEKSTKFLELMYYFLCLLKNEILTIETNHNDLSGLAFKVLISSGQ